MKIVMIITLLLMFFSCGETKIEKPNEGVEVEDVDTNVFTLSFGINEYSMKYGEISTLQSCHNDALQFSELFGNKGQVFINEKATAKRWCEEMDYLSKRANAGDIVLIMQSGHGTLISDVSRDEQDGFDEGTLFYDRIMWDDEIKHYFAKFKKGVNVLSFWDTCHSGTGTRIDPKTAKELEKLGLLVKSAKIDLIKLKQFRDESERYEDEIVCNMIHTGACQDSELALDGKSNGNFTGNLLRVIKRRNKIGLDNTYSDFMTEVKLSIQRQHPNIDIVTSTGEELLSINLPFAL